MFVKKIFYSSYIYVYIWTIKLHRNCIKQKRNTWINKFSLGLAISRIYAPRVKDAKNIPSIDTDEDKRFSGTTMKPRNLELYEFYWVSSEVRRGSQRLARIGRVDLLLLVVLTCCNEAGRFVYSTRSHPEWRDYIYDQYPTQLSSYGRAKRQELLKVTYIPKVNMYIGIYTKHFT